MKSRLGLSHSIGYALGESVRDSSWDYELCEPGWRGEIDVGEA